MARSRRAWRRVALIGLAPLFLGAVLWFAWSLVSGPQDRSETIINVVALLISAGSLAVSILQWRRAPAPQTIHGPARLNRAAETLANAVHIQWEREAGMRSLLNPAPMQLHWSTTVRPVTASDTEVAGSGGGRSARPRSHGNLDKLSMKFSTLRGRRLVVLGEPGAGKTVLAMLLILDLLKGRRPGDPVPVLLSVSSWNPTQHLHGWIVRRLEATTTA